MRALPLILVAFLVSGCDRKPNNSDTHGAAGYLIPDSYQPEPGRLDTENGVRQVRANEFSFAVSRQILHAEIPQFVAAAVNKSPDLTVIVRRYEPKTMDGWEPSKEQLESWQNLWKASGDWENVCVGPTEAPLEEFVFYYKTCDPNPVLEGGIFLLTRRPVRTELPPIPETYILGSCIHEFVNPDLRTDPYIVCHFLRKTAWQDQYSFWLSGDDLRLVHEIESFIEKKLSEWRTS
jgi:hypothetical protein